MEARVKGADLRFKTTKVVVHIKMDGYGCQLRVYLLWSYPNGSKDESQILG
jgi:hypothetical protein